MLNGGLTVNSFRFCVCIPMYGGCSNSNDTVCIPMYGGCSNSNDTANTVLYLRTREASTFSFPSNTPHKQYIFAALHPLLWYAWGHFLAFCVGMLRWIALFPITSAFLYEFFWDMHKILSHASALKWSRLPLKNASSHIAHLWQQCRNSKCVIFREKLLKVLKCYNFLRVQRRRNCSPAASFAHCVMTLYPLKVHLQKFLSIPITQKCQILSCETLVTNEQYIFYKLNLKSRTLLLAAVAADI
jgi:hypothetical protein